MLVRPFPILSRLIWAVALALTLSASPRAAMAQDAALSAELWAEAEAFRITAATDFLFALDASSTPDASLKFAELAAGCGRNGQSLKRGPPFSATRW